MHLSPPLPPEPEPEPGRVSALFRYPVKSMRGEQLARADIQARGLARDREWAVTFPDGRVGSGKSWQHLRKLDGLLRYTAATDGERVRVATPGGRALHAGNPELDSELSRLAGGEVRLARETDVAHFDIAGLHLVSEASLAALARVAADPREVVVDRFRPNILIGGELGDCPEASWVGREIGIGPRVRLRVTERTERCVMPTMPQAHLGPARDMLKTITREFGMFFGVYAAVVAGGTIRVGDAVTLPPAAAGNGEPLTVIRAE